MRNKIIWRFLGIYIFLIFIAVIVLCFFASWELKDYYENKISEKLTSNAFLIEEILKEDIQSNRKREISKKTDGLAQRLNARITIIDGKGRVLSDSKKDAQSMENHIDRLEIVRAMEKRFGESNRFSDTLGYNMKYVATTVNDNDNIIGFIRIALPLIEVESQIRVIYRIILLGGIVAIIITCVIGYFTSKTITSPISQMRDIAQRIAKGDFSRKADVKSKDELGELAKSLNDMAVELQSQIDSLRKMDKVRTDFVANVSHELKTPLTSIKGFIETLENGAIDDRANAKRFISIIGKHAERISNIIDDLLRLSEVELGKDRIRNEKFDLKDLVDEVALGFGHPLSAKKQELITDFNGIDFAIEADKAKIEQVFVNLIDNAIKYTKDGGKIKISIYQKGDNYTVNIEDSGIGIPEEHLGRVFERFYRVDKARSRQLGGTGLGLAIVKHIVFLHGGDINIESEVNKGTKVIFSIPKSV